MSRVSIIRTVHFAICVGLLIGGRAARAEVAVGASFGYTHLSYPDTPRLNNDVIGLPGTEAWGQPGIRLGYLAPSGRWDVFADVGLVLVQRSITDEARVEVLPQAQWNTRELGDFRTFVNGGVGIVHETVLTAYGSSISATRPVFGAGIGVRRLVSDGHGIVRVELRFDHLPKREAELSPSDSFTFLATNMFSVKFGFDLLVVTDTRR